MISHDRKYANKLIFDSVVLTFILSKMWETLKIILRTQFSLTNVTKLVDLFHYY